MKDAPLDAPLYRPATRYEAPRIVGKTLGVDTVSVRELLEVPATRAILFDAAPGLPAIVGSNGARPHMGNFTVRGILGDGMISATAFARIEQAFRDLPSGMWPPR